MLSAQQVSAWPRAREGQVPRSWAGKWKGHTRMVSSNLAPPCLDHKLTESTDPLNAELSPSEGLMPVSDFMERFPLRKLFFLPLQPSLISLVLPLKRYFPGDFLNLFSSYGFLFVILLLFI